jgi:cytoskeleton protein RodZ
VSEGRAVSPLEPLGIGERLRNAREARGLTLGAVEGLTRIRAVYLQALEEEQFDRLPAPAYTRGYLRTYALALGLPANELMEMYPAAFGTSPRPVFSTTPAQIPIRPTAPPSRLRRLVMYVGGTAVTVILVLGFIGYQQLRQFAQPVSPVVSPPSVDSAQPPPQPPPATLPQSKPSVIPVPQTATTGGVELALVATGTSWLNVVVDGTEVFQGLVQAGDAPVWRAQQRLTIRVGNMDAVTLRVNGQLLHPERQGKVWDGVFTAP